MQLDQALKEWAVTVDALLAGETILLIRKGGIRDKKGQFTVQARRVLLLPTYEHQRSDLLKPAFTQVPAAPEITDTVRFTGWAEITHVVALQSPVALERLYPWHMWNQAFIEQRLQWQPQRPLYLLLLRSHRLPQPVSIPQRPEYGGCRSWITLAEPVDISASQPVIKLDAYDAQVAQILDTVGEDGRLQSEAA